MITIRQKSGEVKITAPDDKPIKVEKDGVVVVVEPSKGNAVEQGPQELGEGPSETRPAPGMMGMSGAMQSSRGMMGQGGTGGAMQGQMANMQGMGGMMGTMGGVADEPPPLTKATLAKLNRRIRMNFPNKTSLRKVLAYIKDATREENGSEIPIYLDLAAIEHPDSVLNSPVTIELADAPLKGSMEIVLEQAKPCLAYCVKDGLLFISTPNGVETEKGLPAVPPSDDAPRSVAISAKLEQPVAVRFHNSTPLNDALKVLKSAAIAPNDPSIQIYVNPTVYSEKAGDMKGTSPAPKPGESSAKTKPLLVTMDIEKVPLRTTLRLLLAQVGLEFSLRKGIVIINRKVEMRGMMGGMGMGGMMTGMGGRSSGSSMGNMADMMNKMQGNTSGRGMMSMMGGGSMMGPDPEELDPRSKALGTRLNRPIAMNFPRSTPLRDVLRYVRQSTSVPNEPALPIYFDPVGIADTEKAQNAMVSIDLNDIPLNDTLELVFEQAGLAHCIRDGLMFVSAPAQVSAERSASLAATADEEPESQAIVAELNRPRAVRFDHKLPLKDAVERIERLTRGNGDTPFQSSFANRTLQKFRKPRARRC